LVTGSVVLIGGDPGIGKSTILLQTATHMASKKSSALYVTGEESLSQVALRAQRLDLPTDQLRVMAETCVERICEVLAQERPAVAILTQFKPYIQKLYNLLQVEFHKSVSLLPYLLVLLKIAEQRYLSWGM
jgi:predicted ATP-dependent serine protease